jgi:branched-chain amino acid transport system ATP-binding protein
MTLLQVAGIVKRFGGVDALSDVTFDVSAGQVCSVIGPNGAGKSTLFDIVAGGMRPDGGRVHFAGEDITALPAHQRARRGLARTFQELRLFNSMTALENIAAAALARGRSNLFGVLAGLRSERAERRRAYEQAQALLERFRLGHRRDVPAGLLSHGQKRLVELARALALEPRMLVLDEPTSGLNAENKELFISAVLPSLREGVEAVVIIEHDMDVVMQVSDKVVVLAHGRKICEGSPAAVQADPDVAREYFGT